jgi:HD superfamily phosphohydrolase
LSAESRQNKALVFYDPLYETISFDPTKDALFIELVGNACDLARLVYLKQAGLNYLVFPSSTHNRFEHSLGCWKLGKMALDLIHVDDEGDKKLGEWLEEIHRTNEFLTALLLHDIGHPPFSHVLEANQKLGISHEDTCVSLLLGEDVYHVLRRQADEDGLRTAHEILHDKVDLDFVTALVAPESPANSTDRLTPLQNLISGLIDLDRVDHCLRDSYFMGLKFASFNVQAFLSAVKIDAGANKLYVQEAEVPHILQMLFARELLWRKSLDRPEIRGYEAMLNEAVTRALALDRDLQRLGENGTLQMLSDDELLARVGKVSDLPREFIRMMKNRKDYYHVANTLIVNSEHFTIRELNERRDGLCDKSNDGDIIFHCKFRDRPNPKKVLWLGVPVKPAHTRSGGDLPVLEDIPEFMPLCDYFRQADRTRHLTVRWYAKKSEMAHQIYSRLEEDDALRVTPPE